MNQVKRSPKKSSKKSPKKSPKKSQKKLPKKCISKCKKNDKICKKTCFQKDKDFVKNVTWRVLWNPKKYKTEDIYKKGLIDSIKIAQSEGCNDERREILPQKGDTVAVVWDRKCWMSGIVTKSFTQGSDHKKDKNNIPSSLKSNRCRRFAKILVQSLEKPIPVRVTGQGTWVYMKNKPSLEL